MTPAECGSCRASIDAKATYRSTQSVLYLRICVYYGQEDYYPDGISAITSSRCQLNVGSHIDAQRRGIRLGYLGACCRVRRTRGRVHQTGWFA